MTGHIDSYEKAEAYINGIPKFTGKNSLEDTRRFLEHMGNPLNGRKVIHVAGTNGKGSVCAYLCSVLREAHISAGMFTSPHLVTMRERIAVDGRMATEQEFMAAFNHVAEKLEALPPELERRSYHPSFFEFLFFMAADYFRSADVEYVVLETGLGGKLDATNAVDDKKICVITSIGYDHMEYLGSTLSEIAAQKAGILRKGVPVVYPGGQTEAAKSIEECARAVQAAAVPVDPDAIKVIKIKNKTIDFSFRINYYDYIGFTVSSSALYQTENSALAIKALDCLADPRITMPVIQEGIRKMFWEARMEEIMPGVWLDGAHNIDGIRSFLDTVETQPCGGKRKLLFSVVKDKQYLEVIRELALSGLFDEIGIAAMHNDRALPLDVLTESFRRYTTVMCKAYDEVKTAFDEMVFYKNDEDRVYIVGSLYLAGEIKALLRRPRRDQF